MLDCLGRDLGHMHAQVGPAWGKPWRPLNPAPAPLRYWLERVALFEQGIPPALLELEPDWLRARLSRLRGELQGLDFTRPRLIHGDLAPGHVYLNADRELTWIDFGTVAYGHPAEDLAALRGWLHPEDFTRVMQAYRAACALEPPSAAELHCFTALRLLEKLRSRVNKRRHHAAAPTPRETTFREEQRKTEQQLKAVWRN